MELLNNNNIKAKPMTPMSPLALLSRSPHCQRMALLLRGRGLTLPGACLCFCVGGSFPGHCCCCRLSLASLYSFVFHHLAAACCSEFISLRGCLCFIGWPKSPYGVFHKTKDTFFIFTNNFIDLDVLSRLAISRVVSRLVFSINVSI